jgi:hypothetical protein
MACRGQEIRFDKADTKIRWGGTAVGNGFRGRNPFLRVAVMYTGTMISDLMATVARAEQKIQQQRIDEELHAIFAMQIPIDQGDQLFMGAA